MKKYRFAALALAVCAASLSAAACSAGSPAASSSAPSSAAPSSPVQSQSASAAMAGPTIQGRMLSLKGPLGSFPVPAGAKVGENMAGGSSVIIVFGSITPSDVSRFYATALPQSGYKVTRNSMVNKAGYKGALIEFSGHGFTGTIDALSQMSGPSLADLGTTNVTTILASAAN